RGDYIVPYFNNQLRLDKPPLTYWAQTVSYRVFGENDFAARFPSAIAAALTALVIFAWGMRLSGEKLGLRAAIIFTLSLQTFFHAMRSWPGNASSSMEFYSRSPWSRFGEFRR